MIKAIDLRKSQDNDLYEKLLSRNNMDIGEIQKRVEEMVNNVRKNGDKAVFEYTKRFDGVELSGDSIMVSESEIEEAYKKVDGELLKVIQRAKASIKSFHSNQKDKSWFAPNSEGVILGQMISPLSIVGVYVPGGTAPLPSSVLMNVVPAKVAGVERIIMATPPGKDGKINPAILVAAKEAGVDKTYKMGGAQAIAAMAFGTETIPKVDKVTGPGNIYVATAKRMVYGFCDIDMIAGPSEILVVADGTANAGYVAADLLSQAEHDVMASSILITTSEELALNVQEELKTQTERLSRKDIINKSLEDYGAVILVESLDHAVEIANRIAPEHLELCVKEPFNLIGAIKNAGAIFLGNFSPEPLGDYFAGPNHVLPTSGTARFFSPLSVSDFIKKTSLISYTEKALYKVKDDVIRFAEAEGLTAHANAIRVRF